MKSKKIFQVILCLTLILSSCKASEDLNDTSNKPIPDENLDSGYTVTCLEKKPDDTKSFGTKMAVSDDYLAVSDYKANKVVIYTRSSDDTWQRKHEIYPPENTNTEKSGYVFAYDLAINNDILIIKSSTDYRKLINTRSQKLAELYAVSLSNQEGDLILKKISYPEPEKTSITSLTFLEENIAFAARTISDGGKGVNRVYIMNPISGEIVNTIESPEIQYPHNLVNIENRFRVDLGVQNNSLITAITGGLKRYWDNSIFLFSADGQPEKIIFDQEIVDGKLPNDPTLLSSINYDISAFATSDKLMAIGRHQNGDQNTLIFTGFPEISQFKIIQPSGVLDVDKSQVLISYRISTNSFSSQRKGDSDLTLVGLKDNKIKVKSEINWERGDIRPDSFSYFDVTLGKLGEQGLFASGRGTVVYLPFKDLPEKYEIKLTVCGEQ